MDQAISLILGPQLLYFRQVEDFATFFRPSQTIPVSADNPLHLKISAWEISPYGNLSPTFMVFYWQLSSQHDPPYLSKWERDLNTTFSEDQKTQILFYAQKSSICKKYQEITFKIVSLVSDFISNISQTQPTMLAMWYSDWRAYQRFLEVSKAVPFLAAGTADCLQSYRHFPF